MTIEQISVPQSGETLGLYPGDPQLLGLIDSNAREASLHDPDSVHGIIEGKNVPLLVPISYQTEANQNYFQGSESYFFNWIEANDQLDTKPLVGKLANVASGTKIALEGREGDMAPIKLLKQLVTEAGREMSQDPNIIDSENGTLAAVTHYFTPVNRERTPERSFSTMKESYDYLVDTGKWEKFTRHGVKFVNGSDITEEQLEQLWDVYDDTFDKLVENHPSAQKQSKDYFVGQVTLPESGITYAQDGNKIVSALFIIDNVEACPWLNSAYFKEKNPNGTTIFMPGISTRIDKRGQIHSAYTISAMSEICELIPDITAAATQCTNRSEAYVPRLTNRYTKGTCNLQLEKTQQYRYPVYILE